LTRLEDYISHLKRITKRRGKQRINALKRFNTVFPRYNKIYPIIRPSVIFEDDFNLSPRPSVIFEDDFNLSPRPSVIFENDFNLSPTLKISPS